MRHDNSKEIQKHWDELSRRAIPKNSAWRHLEELMFEADYTEADAGEPPKNAIW